MSKKQPTERKNVALGEFVRKGRESRGLNYYQAAEASGLDHTYWRKLEVGVYQMPSPRALELVAKVIKAKPADLYALAGYKIGGDLPGFGPYLRSTTYLPPEAIDQLEGYFEFLRNQYGIPKDRPVFPPKPKTDDHDESKDDGAGAGVRSAA